MFNKILCPTDLGERSFPALEKAVQIAHQFNASITMLNVHDEFMNDEEMQMLRVSVNKMKEKFKKTADESKRKMQDAMKKLHADDVEIEYVLHGGNPKEVIARYANNNGFDLIVITADRRDSILDVISSTTTDHVIHDANCPTLVIPYKR